MILSTTNYYTLSIKTTEKGEPNLKDKLYECLLGINKIELDDSDMQDWLAGEFENVPEKFYKSYPAAKARLEEMFSSLHKLGDCIDCSAEKRRILSKLQSYYEGIPDSKGRYTLNLILNDSVPNSHGTARKVACKFGENDTSEHFRMLAFFLFGVYPSKVREYSTDLFLIKEEWSERERAFVKKKKSRSQLTLYPAQSNAKGDGTFGFKRLIHMGLWSQEDPDYKKLTVLSTFSTRERMQQISTIDRNLHRQGSVLGKRSKDGKKKFPIAPQSFFDSFKNNRSENLPFSLKGISFQMYVEKWEGSCFIRFWKSSSPRDFLVADLKNGKFRLTSGSKDPSQDLVDAFRTCLGQQVEKWKKETEQEEEEEESLIDEGQLGQLITQVLSEES